MDNQKTKRNFGRFHYQREYVIYTPEGKVVWRGPDRSRAIDLTFSLNVFRDQQILSGNLIVSIDERKRALMRIAQRRKRQRELGELPPYHPDYKTPLEDRLKQREFGNRYRARQRGDEVGLTKKQQAEALEKKRASSRKRSADYRARKKAQESGGGHA